MKVLCMTVAHTRRWLMGWRREPEEWIRRVVAPDISISHKISECICEVRAKLGKRYWLRDAGLNIAVNCTSGTFFEPGRSPTG